MQNSLKIRLFTLSTISLLSACNGGNVWPEIGRSEVIEMVEKREFAFDCYQSKWAEENQGRLKQISNLRSLGTNQECEFKSEDIYWREFPDAVNATLRCESNGVVGEYTVSVFQTKRTRYGDYFCNAAHFWATENHELGSVTDSLKTPY